MSDRAFMSSLDRTTKAADIDPARYAAIFHTGWHGVMRDFPSNAALQQVTREIYENGGVVSSVCQGACGLLNITLSDDTLLADGRTVTGFSTKAVTAKVIETLHQDPQSLCRLHLGDDLRSADSGQRGDRSADEFRRLRRSTGTYAIEPPTGEPP